MAEYKRIANIKGERGDKGLKGDTGSIAYAEGEIVAWDQPFEVEMVGPESHRGARFKLPMPTTPETVTNDESNALLIKGPTQTRAALLDDFVAQEEAVATFSPMDRVSTLVKTPDIRAYSGASDSIQRMELPSHIADKFQATHPSVKFFPEGWNGWRYWMAFTPYPLGDAAHEDPNIAVSQDGKTWTTPAGFVNPLDNAPDAAHYNADTELALSPDGSTLYCMWRYTDTVAQTVEFKVRSTTDGVNWTPAVVAMTHADYNVANYVSPTLAHDGTQWVMWGIDQAATPNRLVRLTAPDVTGPWSPAIVCTASAQAGRDMWHIEVTRTADGYLALMNDTDLNRTGGNGQLFLMSSVDGLTWDTGYSIIPQKFGNEFNAIYRGSLIPTSDGFDVWFGAYMATTNYWGIFRAQIKPNPIARTTTSRWLPAWMFRPPVVGPTEGVVQSIINGWMLDANALESVATWVTMPGWERFAVEAWFATTTTGTGNVVLGLSFRQFAEGSVLALPPTVTSSPVATDGATGRVLRVPLLTSLLVNGDAPWYLRLYRDAGNAADTYPADVLFLGLKLTRMA